jgi:hypothetical protein
MSQRTGLRAHLDMSHRADRTPYLLALGLREQRELLLRLARFVGSSQWCSRLTHGNENLPAIDDATWQAHHDLLEDVAKRAYQHSDDR